MVLQRSVLNALSVCVLSLALAACDRPNPLSVQLRNGGNGGGGSACGNSTGPIIQAMLSRTTTLNAGVAGGYTLACQVYALSQSYATLSVTAATLIQAGGAPVTIPLNGTGGASLIGGAWSYVPGQTDTIQCTVAGYGTYSGSVLLPGGASIPPLSAPGPITWQVNGTATTLLVSGGSCSYSGTITSGAFNESGNSAFGCNTTYTIQLDITQANALCPWGSANYGMGSMLSAVDMLMDSDSN